MRQKFVFVVFMVASMIMAAQDGLESDVFKTGNGELRITFIGHASLLFQFKQAQEQNYLTIYVDPDGRLTDFSRLPKADLVLVTHGHGDHFDARAIETLRQADTEVWASPACQPLPARGRVLKNGDHAEFAGVAVDAVPAYNIVHKRPDGTPYHPRGEGNGYVLGFAAWRVYVAGDTEDIPEMAKLGALDIAFLPMNLPYTMTPEMTARAAGMIKPRVLYPYHFSNSDPQKLVSLLKADRSIDVRIRKLN